MAMLFSDIGKETKKLLGDVRHPAESLAELVVCGACGQHAPHGAPQP